MNYLSASIYHKDCNVTSHKISKKFGKPIVLNVKLFRTTEGASYYPLIAADHAYNSSLPV